MMLIVYARSSAIWQPLAVLVAAALTYGVAWWFARRSGTKARFERAPLYCCAFIVAAIARGFRCTSRTWMQSMRSAARRHLGGWSGTWCFKRRTTTQTAKKVFGVPMSISPLGDGVPMYFFDRELKTRGIGHNDVAIQSAELRDR